MLRFVERPRLRFGSLPAKWLRCLGWFASATEIDVTGNSSSSTVQKVARAISQGRGRQCSVPLGSERGWDRSSMIAILTFFTP
jgi:hypothetical protein